MHLDDAQQFIVEKLRQPHANQSEYGYAIYLPKIVSIYLEEIEKIPEHLLNRGSHPRFRAVMPAFCDAAWELCRRGILRPSVQALSDPGTANGLGYSLTAVGLRWINETGPKTLIPGGDRLSEMFQTLAEKLGPGFSQRSVEASTCHRFGAYLACCAL
jgi:hypothetical protein